jgi:putative phosphoribosyl transferase
MTFRDREQAGRQLADKLERLGEERPVVLGLARGGLPVAFEVARALHAPLDVLVVRKIGAPGSPEYAIGAVAEAGARYLRREALVELGLDREEVEGLAAREGVEVSRRVLAYRGARPMTSLEDRTVIVVDDGVATGATVHAASRAARTLGAARVVLAAPVIAAASLAELRDDFDEVVAVDTPEPLYAVGLWYERFPQVSDAEVLRCLERAGEEHEARELWADDWLASRPASDTEEEDRSGPVSLFSRGGRHA